MATRAFVNVTHVQADNDPMKGHFACTVSFFGDNVIPGDSETQGPHGLSAIATVTASSVQLKNQLIDTVIEFAASRGMTIGNGDVILGSLEIV